MKKNKTGLLKPLFFSSLFLFLVFLLPAFGGEPSTPSPLLMKAKSCKSSLASISKRKRRSKWLSCISLEKRIFKESSSEEVRLQAVSDLIDLYHQLGRFSGKISDQNKENYWKRIQTQFTIKNDNILPLSNSIYHLRTSNQGNTLRIVLDLKNPATYETHENKESNLLQINFLNTGIQPDLENKIYILDGREMKAQLIPIDGKTELSIINANYESFKVSQLPNPNRWIIDIQKGGETNTSLTSSDRDKSVPPPKKTLQDINPPNQGIHKIIIDPGHGGKDPGAIGLSGFTEKEAVLDIGIRLRELILNQLKIDVIMTRSKDVFIPLGERTKMANEANADLFISIHANSSPHRTTHGIEIYLLGQSSDKRALRTAARENNVTEEEASNLDKNLLSIKKDLTQEYKKEESLELAHITRSSFLNLLRPSYPVVDLGVKTAPFYVLMNTSMPSILAEVSFISNPAEEQRLKSKSYRQKMAESLLEGIKKFIASSSNTSSF